MSPKLALLPRALKALRRHATQGWPCKVIKSRLDRAVASIAFDDFAQNSWTVGGQILQAASVRGTYFVSGSYCGREAHGIKYFEGDDLVAAHANGHEVACHTFDHRTVSGLSPGEIEATLRQNQDFVRSLLGDVVMTSFAFPHGETSIRTKRILSRHFAACRGVFPGINSGRIDLSQLKAVELAPYVPKSYSIDRMIEVALANRGWLIIVGHDVANVHSPYGCTPRVLEIAVSKLLAAKIEILPIKNALGRAAFVQ